MVLDAVGFGNAPLSNVDDGIHVYVTPVGQVGEPPITVEVNMVIV